MAQIQFSLIKIIKIACSEHLLPPTPLRPITSHFLSYPHLKVGVICVSPLKMKQKFLIKLEMCYNRLFESK